MLHMGVFSQDNSSNSGVITAQLSRHHPKGNKPLSVALLSRRKHLLARPSRATRTRSNPLRRQAAAWSLSAGKQQGPATVRAIDRKLHGREAIDYNRCQRQVAKEDVVRDPSPCLPTDARRNAFQEANQ